jgi:uncharacterized protein GlcG (DUF336 family)
MMSKPFSIIIKGMLLCLPLQTASANDILTVKTIGLELARDIASESIIACRKMGYQVSAVVVDRSGIIRAALRDDLAARFTLELAEDKANSVVLANTSSGELRKNRDNIRHELNEIDGILLLQGGIAINAAGSRLGAVGVSGAPGGDIDEACAIQALEKFEDRLEFAD